MKKNLTIVTLIILASLFIAPYTVLAQEELPESGPPELSISTKYPSQVVGIGENINLDIDLSLSDGAKAQVINLEVKDVPEGWTADFRGGGKIVKSVYVSPGNQASVDLRITPPDNVTGGTYTLVVIGKGKDVKAEFPIELTVKEKLPPSLSFKADLPTLKGAPDTNFRFNVTLKNDGDEDLVAELTAEVPVGFLVSIKSAGQETTSVPVPANGSKRLTVEVRIITDVNAGSYPILVHAQSENAQATQMLTAEITGQPKLRVTGPDGRLSGEANAGKETTFKIVVVNEGSAPAQGITMSSTEPRDWNITFNPEMIPVIGPGEQVDVTAIMQPSENAVAGDYVVTIKAQPAEGARASADFRITVTTSTLWGLAGIALIAVAVLVVGFAVMRFGRR